MKSGLFLPCCRTIRKAMNSICQPHCRFLYNVFDNPMAYPTSHPPLTLLENSGLMGTVSGDFLMEGGKARRSCGVVFGMGVGRKVFFSFCL